MPETTESYQFPDDGRTPNNPLLPVVLMRETAAATQDDPATWLEKTFKAHGWGATWRWGLYPFHHFHSTDHEVLGVARGSARLILGGENGREFDVAVGDVIVLPAGAGHKCLDASPDFQVVGGYPQAKEPDVIRAGDEGLESVREQIAAVPVPDQDPIHGPNGPLLRFWQV